MLYSWSVQQFNNKGNNKKMEQTQKPTKSPILNLKFIKLQV